MPEAERVEPATENSYVVESMGFLYCEMEDVHGVKVEV